MKIAVLGWGSLIANPGELLIDRSNGWLFNGPKLPIEFARVSQNGRLTLVINQGSRRIQTKWAPMATLDLQEAIDSLMNREKITNQNRIGFYNARTETWSNGVDQVFQEEIIRWISLNPFDAIIWTGLEGNFQTVTKTELTIENVGAYLRSLDYKKFQAAANYILTAPPSTATDFRLVLDRQLRDGSLIPDSVLYHEAGHFVVAHALAWSITDIRVNVDGSPIIFKVEKLVGPTWMEYYRYPSTEVERAFNLERALITLGGKAADIVFNFSDVDQYTQDNINRNTVLANIATEFRFSDDEMELRARQIVEANQIQCEKIVSWLRSEMVTGLDFGRLNNYLNGLNIEIPN